MTKIAKVLPESMRKIIVVAMCLGPAGMSASNICLAEPYVVLKGGSTQWENFEGDDADTFVSLGAGFNVSKYLSIEIAYNDLGKVSADKAETINVDAYSTAVAAYLRWPISKYFGCFLKAGLESWKADIDAPDYTDRVYGTGSFAGVGVLDSFGQVDVSVSYELHKLDEKGQPADDQAKYDDFDFDVVALGVAYRF